jgi:hypothetical protein
LVYALAFAVAILPVFVVAAVFLVFVIIAILLDAV